MNAYICASSLYGSIALDGNVSLQVAITAPYYRKIVQALRALSNLALRINQFDLNPRVTSNFGAIFRADQTADPGTHFIDTPSQSGQLDIKAQQSVRNCLQHLLGPLKIGLRITSLIAQTPGTE